MENQVLARKWRPQQFDQLVGQQHIVKALTNALENNRIHHAYLFTGTRGVGKTTIARLLAKCLECEKGVSANPCGECANCIAITEGRFSDLYEIDAASRTKVEDTRELLENAQYLPAQGRFKIYLIDEVHMLSNHSFNALLKTLEEPPEHVKFLLATTEPEKLPITVLSRCLQFHLHSLTPDLIEQHLHTILTAENITFEAAALRPIANAANGSVRDSLSLLDQSIAFSNANITLNDTNTMLGNLPGDIIINLVNAIAEQNAQQLLDLINNMQIQAFDFDQALAMLLDCLHQVSLAQFVDQITSPIFTDDQIKLLANKISKEDCQLYYQIALIGRRDLPYASSLKAGFEMLCLRMMAFAPNNTKPANIQAPTQETKTITTENKTPVNLKSNTIQSYSDWSEMIKQANLTGLTKVLAQHCTLKDKEQNKLTLLLDPEHTSLLNQSAKTRLAEQLSKLLNQTIILEIIAADQQVDSPARLAKQQQDSAQQAAKTSINNDSKLQSLIDSFDATISNTSINNPNNQKEETS